MIMGFQMQEAIASEWMTKDDTDFNGMDLFVAKITQEELGEAKEQKYALHFTSHPKVMILNKTNIRILVSLFGGDSDMWINKQICVYNDPTVGFGGQITGGLRVRPVQQMQQQQQPVQEFDSNGVPTSGTGQLPF